MSSLRHYTFDYVSDDRHVHKDYCADQVIYHRTDLIKLGYPL
jgi:hypothetical protein